MGSNDKKRKILHLTILLIFKEIHDIFVFSQKDIFGFIAKIRKSGEF